MKLAALGEPVGTVKREWFTDYLEGQVDHQFREYLKQRRKLLAASQDAINGSVWVEGGRTRLNEDLAKDWKLGQLATLGGKPPTEGWQFLQQVGEIVEERGRYYDHPLDNFTRIGKMWAPLLGEEPTLFQVYALMVGVKLAREQYQHTDDNLIDIAGYTLAYHKALAEQARRSAKT
jgi:uncharacterized protein DUF6378